MATYYIQWKGVIEGPFQSASILQMLESNSISKMHLVSSDRRQWVPLGRSTIYAEANRAVAFNVAQSEQSSTQNSSMLSTKPLAVTPNTSRKISKDIKTSDFSASPPRQNQPHSPTPVASNQSSPAFITGLCAVLGVITLVVILVRQPETSQQLPVYPPQVRDATIVAWCASQSAAAARSHYDGKLSLFMQCQNQALLYSQIQLTDVDPKLQEHIRQQSALWQNIAQLCEQFEAECLQLQENTNIAKGLGAVFGALIGGGNNPLADAAAGGIIAEELAKANANQQFQVIQQRYYAEFGKFIGKFKEIETQNKIIADELSKKYQVSLKLQSNNGGDR